MLKIIWLLLLLALAMPVPVPAAPTGSVADLVKALDAQVDRAEKERLADPWFIKDLRAIIRKYDDPWTREILSSDFSDRGSQPPAPWQVRAGEFLVDWRHGLRSVVEPKASPEPEPAASEQQPDVATALLGALLQGALDSQPETPSGSSASTADPTEARIVAPVSFGGAFSVSMKISSRLAGANGKSLLAFGPYQGKDAIAGYRLVYRAAPSKDSGALELVRQTVNGGQAIVERASKPVQLGDGAVHELLWTRDRDGRMAVNIGGKQVIDVTDRGYSGKFDGFAIRNGGGDFAVREFDLKTTP